MGNRALSISRLTVLLAILPIAVAFAESPEERKAREDLERQLKSMVGTPPTKIRIEYVGLDQPMYELVEATFKLDGRSLPVNLRELNQEGDHLIFHGDVLPGSHHLDSKFLYLNKASQVVSAEGGFKSKPGSEITFKNDTGIEVRVKVTPTLNMSGPIKDRITVTSPAVPVMLAKVDDGSMPEPATRPKLVLAEAADAGVAAQSPQDKAAAAAEAKKKAREDALAAKQAAADEKKRMAEEAKAARLAAAEEKKRAADEAKSAKLAAAEEKKRAAEEAKAAKLAAAEEAKHPKVVAIDTAAVDAGLVPVAVVAEVDAGPVLVAVAPKPVEAVAVAPPVEGESGLPMPVLIAVGAVALGLLLFFASRRKKS